MRNRLILVSMLLCSVDPAIGQVSIGIVSPNVSIGINVPLYPELVSVPGYPVYYAPSLNSNYFFYDGMYWVYWNDNWYASSWYNGPWGLVAPESVPVFVLRIPVGYYRQPPAYFLSWRRDAPPRWGEHWGGEWEHRRSGWDRWDRDSTPAPAPLPVYQRQYSGDRYPRGEQQRALRSQNDQYQPRDPEVRRQFEAQQGRRTPAPAERGTQGRPQALSPGAQGTQRSSPPVGRSAPAAPRAPAAQNAVTPRGQETGPKGVGHETGQRSQPVTVQRQQIAPVPRGEAIAPQGKAAPQEARRPQESGQGKGREKADDRGQEHR
jgi:hypothetical protein